MNGPHLGIEYKDFLRVLCERRGVKNYLEIGVQSGANLSNIRVDNAVGVDPEFALKFDVTLNKNIIRLYRMTGDTFFHHFACQDPEESKFDFSFLDGMHLFEYLLRDIYNAERFSSRAGVIAMHDCLPFDGEMIERDYQTIQRTPGPYSTFWTGDVWKVVPILKKYRPDLRITLIDCSPTGLVCLSNLDPNSRVLEKDYYQIIDEFKTMPNDLAAINDFYANNELISAAKILHQYDHTLFFRQ